MENLTLGQYLVYRRDLAHDDLVVETPAACQDLWARGRATGCRLGRLYVLRRPLSPGVGGEYHPGSGDVWVLHDPARPDQACRYLLHELAHAAQPPDVPAATIDAYCDEELATEERARALAAAWGVAERYADEDLQAALVAVETLRERLTAAGDLAGTRDPGAARAAHTALLRLAAATGWTVETLDDAISGVADEAANARALDFDRCALRGRWRLGWGTGIDFGPLALAPDTASATLLRSALRTIAEGRRPGREVYVERAAGDAYRYRFAFLRLERQDDLEAILAAANVALLAHPDAYALATWDAFGDAADTRTQRLYRLWVRYGGARGHAEPPEAQLWVLALPRRPHELRAEAAFQQYVRGWRAHTHLRVDDWRQGLLELTEQIQTAR